MACPVIIKEEVEVIEDDSVAEIGEELIVNGDFKNGTADNWINVGCDYDIEDGVLRIESLDGSSDRLQQSFPVIQGLTYSISFRGYLGQGTGQRVHADTLVLYEEDLPSEMGVVTKTFVASTTGDAYVRLYASVNLAGSELFCDEVSVKQITTVSQKRTELGITPFIKKDERGLVPRFVEWVQDGVISTPSDQAYGEWYFKTIHRSNHYINFISDRKNKTLVGFNGYQGVLQSDGKIILRVPSGTIAPLLFQTATGYLTLTKDYEYLIQRLQSEGKFKLIGDDITYPADTFAVFIRSKDDINFDSKKWTLVDTTGGSGSNPVMDDTYKTSKFISIDGDTGDRLYDVITKNQVEQ